MASQMANREQDPPENAEHFSGLKHVMAKID
jgi:hypothetical protein